MAKVGGKTTRGKFSVTWRAHPPCEVCFPCRDWVFEARIQGCGFDLCVANDGFRSLKQLGAWLAVVMLDVKDYIKRKEEKA